MSFRCKMYQTKAYVNCECVCVCVQCTHSSSVLSRLLSKINITKPYLFFYREIVRFCFYFFLSLCPSVRCFSVVPNSKVSHSLFWMNYINVMLSICEFMWRMFQQRLWKQRSFKMTNSWDFKQHHHSKRFQATPPQPSKHQLIRQKWNECFLLNFTRAIRLNFKGINNFFFVFLWTIHLCRFYIDSR